LWCCCCYFVKYMFTPLTLQIARASRQILRHWCQRHVVDQSGA